MSEVLEHRGIHAPAAARMAESVTRHALITEGEKVRCLLSGMDSLDLGLYVCWGGDWSQRLKFLNSMKQLAQKENGGIPLQMGTGRMFTFHAGGKGNNYRFHLEFPGYHLYIARGASIKNSPNVYVSFSAKTLWSGEMVKGLEEIEKDLKIIGGGGIQRLQCSRCDLTADFLVPGGLSLEFLQSHKVTRSRKSNSYLSDDRLETFYAGDKGGPVQLRIYDKTTEVIKDGKKNWFWDLWGVEPGAEIWRVEFQLRRPVLKQYGVNTLSELQEKVGGIWKDLTQRWFSLRLPDNESTDRRTMHPFWKEVQRCGEKLGPAITIRRNMQGANTASIDWYLAHIDGCLVSIAARLGHDKRGDTLNEVLPLLNRRDERAFNRKSIKKAITLGTSIAGGAK